MKTLNQFKKEMGIDIIDLLQGKGRMYCKVKDIDIIVSKSCDLTKPLFIISTTNQETGNVVANLFTIINSDIKMVASI